MCTIQGSIAYIFPSFFYLSQTELFIGLGCALNWVSVTRYFTHSRQYSLITRTLQVAVPMNIKIMMGIMPIFIGYVLFSMASFWTYTSHFSNFSDTAYCLFCMMNGDSILLTFQYTTKQYAIMGQLLCYSFTFMSICVWQNMNLVIVEDSYLNVKYKKTYSWLTGEEDDQPPPEDGEGQPAAGAPPGPPQPPAQNVQA